MKKTVLAFVAAAFLVPGRATDALILVPDADVDPPAGGGSVAILAPAQQSAAEAPDEPTPAAPKAKDKATPRPAGTPQVAPAAKAESAAPAARSLGERVNVRIDLRLRTQRGSSPAVEKTLALVTIGDNSRTSVRTGSDIPTPVPGSNGSITYRNVALDADVRATVEGKRVVVVLVLSYKFASAGAEGEGRAAGTVSSSVQNEIRAVLEDGKPLIVSDQVDAATDYRITVEAKATILR